MATGAHTLKIAVVDDRGRRGSVEHTFRAGADDGRAAPRDRSADRRASGPESASADAGVGRELTSGMVHGYIELYSDSAERLKNTTVMFEVAQNEQGARARRRGRQSHSRRRPSTPNRRAIEGSVPDRRCCRLATTSPAPSSASTARRVGHVARPFRVGRDGDDRGQAEAGRRSATLETGTPIPFASRIERFDRGSVLTPQVVGFFMERMNFGARGEPNAAPAIDHARAGRFDEAVQSLSTRTGTLCRRRSSAAWRCTRKEISKPAAAKFRETLRLDSEFFPAAFYLGSCYAAGGRDDEAVGAWQLSLVTESDAPFIYTLLGDALLRLREAAAGARDPERGRSATGRRTKKCRCGSAPRYAMAGKRAEALQKLEPYLDKHPDDHERHFVALRMLYEARADGKPVRSPPKTGRCSPNGRPRTRPPRDRSWRSSSNGSAQWVARVPPRVSPARYLATRV